MLNKLIIYRQSKVKSDTMSGSELASYVVGDVLNISPAAWADEAGLSHYGWVVEGLKLKHVKLLDDFIAVHSHATVLDLYEYRKGKKVDRSVEDTLKTVGLRINELAE